MPQYRKIATVEATELTEAQVFETKLGPQRGEAGDFAITNPDGETYPCPRDTFLSTYIEA